MRRDPEPQLSCPLVLEALRADLLGERAEGVVARPDAMSIAEVMTDLRVIVGHAPPLGAELVHRRCERSAKSRIRWHQLRHRPMSRGLGRAGRVWAFGDGGLRRGQSTHTPRQGVSGYDHVTVSDRATAGIVG
jgi:hypothetical protein